MTYTHNLGCGYCDFLELCDQVQYCQRCCTNLDNPAEYKNCGGHIKEVNEVDNMTGAVITIDKAEAILY